MDVAYECIKGKENVDNHSSNTTWRPPGLLPVCSLIKRSGISACCLLCDVIWVPPEYNTTSESPDDVTVQLRRGFQEFANWLKFSRWGLP